jgi:Ca2+-transporting ATPase
LLIITNLSRTRHMFDILKGQNRSLYLIIGSTSTILISILSIPELRTLFHFSFLTAGEILITFCAGLVSILWFEALKLYRRVTVKK